MVAVLYAGTHQSPRGLDYTKIEYKKYYLLQQLVGFVCFSTYTSTNAELERLGKPVHIPHYGKRNAMRSESIAGQGIPLQI